MSDPYAQIAVALPNEVAIGGALITMVEPNPGFEHEYNRWYEDDHFYSGAMHGPWTFAGRRFVAPRSLRERRVAVADSVVQPADAGCYISLYWVTKGHEEDNERWSFTAMNDVLMPNGRGFVERTHVYTAFQRFRFGVVRDGEPMKPHLALDAPFRGLIVEVVDAPDEAGLAPLEAWLQERLAADLPGTPAGMVLAFSPVPFSQGRVDKPDVKPVDPPAGVGRQLCLLWFLDVDAHELGEGDLRGHHQALADSGLGELRFCGSFVPTHVGTDDYVDQLR